MQTHFARDTRQYATTTGGCRCETWSREQVDNGPLYLNCVFARRVRISGSCFVIRTVCSKCAYGRLSAVPTVLPPPSTRTSDVPMLIIGSIATVIPAFNLGPLPRLP